MKVVLDDIEKKLIESKKKADMQAAETQSATENKVEEAKVDGEPIVVEKKKKIGFWKEFKSFIAKGNIIDLAVAVIIGGVFNKVVSSLVNDIINPIIALILGKADLSDLVIVLKQAVGDTPAVVIKYGSFLQTIMDFLVVALSIFFAIKVAKKINAKIEKTKDTIVDQINTLVNSKKHKSDQEVKDIDTQIEQLQKSMPQPTAAATPTVEVDSTQQLLTEIRDLLKKQGN